MHSPNGTFCGLQTYPQRDLIERTRHPKVAVMVSWPEAAKGTPHLSASSKSSASLGFSKCAAVESTASGLAQLYTLPGPPAFNTAE